jgi:hypothetical protein
MPFNNMALADCTEGVNATAITPYGTWDRENNLKHIKPVHFSQREKVLTTTVFHACLFNDPIIQIIQSNDRITRTTNYV